MKRKICYLIVGAAVALMSSSGVAAQDVDAKTARQKLRAGNDDYKNEKYNEDEINYRRSLDADPSSSMAVYNIGNALFRQGKYDEAARQYENLTGRERPADEKTVSSANWYNLGNSLYMQEKYAESIEAYKNALRRNPDDHEARYNLRMAQLKLQQQQQQQQDNQQQQQNQNQQQNNQQNQQNNEQNRDKDKENQQNSSQQQPNPNQQNQDRQEERPADNEHPQGTISPENAQQILDAMQQDEKATQEKVQKALLEQRQKRKTDKEW